MPPLVSKAGSRSTGSPSLPPRSTGFQPVCVPLVRLARGGNTGSLDLPQTGVNSWTLPVVSCGDGRQWLCQSAV